MSEHEIISTVAEQAGQFESLYHVASSSPEIQAALIVQAVGLGLAFALQRAFSTYIRRRPISYRRPYLAQFIRTSLLPLVLIMGPVGINIGGTHLASGQIVGEVGEAALELYDRLLATIVMLIIGYVISRVVPIVLHKRAKSDEEQADFEQWKSSRGFADDEEGAFGRIYRWVPPEEAPEGIDAAQFAEMLSTPEGLQRLEMYRTADGAPAGHYVASVDNPAEAWKRLERAKYEAYLSRCISADGAHGQRLRLGRKIEEVFTIDAWREERRRTGYRAITPGSRPPGYTAKKRKDLPRSATQIISLGIMAVTVLAALSAWGVDLFVLATATGGLSIGIGLAMQETIQNWMAYIFIRKDKIVSEGDRVMLDSGYDGYIHRITPRVTYVRHALHESVATIPTRQLVNAQVVNYTQHTKLVPAEVKVGVSYLNDPRQVAAILIKVGRRVMRESRDASGAHIVRQRRCPYAESNLPSCGCDAGMVVDVDQPVVRFTSFNDSSLDFALWVYVRDYGSQFKAETDMRMIMYDEFKAHDIRIPWPIRTVYQGDEKRESDEIARLDEQRSRALKEYGTGDISRGGSED